MAISSGEVKMIFGAIESEEKKALDTTARADDVATAVMMDVARYDPELSRKAGQYLDKQSALIHLQVAHFEGERRIASDAAKRKRASDRLRMCFQVILIPVAAAVVVGAAFMIQAAISSHSVVIDLFDAPRPLAERGITGRTVAAGLLDVLARIQVASRSQVERRALSNAWTNDIAIQVPETGLSIGQIERMLKALFGHDQHIDGDLILTETGGFALTVRGNGILAKTFNDEQRNLEKLLVEAGEYVYSQSQPGLWTAYLANNDRADDAIHFAQAIYAGVNANDKPYVLNYWANAITAKGGGEVAQRAALPLYREALRLKPDYWVGYNNVMYSLTALGDEEGAVHVGEQMMQAAGGRPGRAPESSYQTYDAPLWDLTALRASGIADMEAHGGIGSMSSVGDTENLDIALFETQMHDLDGATLRILTTPGNKHSVTDVAAATLVRALLAEERGDLSAAVREWDAYAQAYANAIVATSNPQTICYAALSYEKAGQPDKADTVLKATGKLKFVDCYRFHGDVLDARHDWMGARAWYSKAIQLAPSLPAGYYAFGAALAKHGDLVGASEQLRLANLKGPHWADPLKAWGDVLMRQGRDAQALLKYDQALKYAPNWKQLKDARKSAIDRATTTSPLDTM